jgi:hypothetical protein
VDLQFDTGSLRYNQRDWRKSTLEGMLSEGGEERVVLDLEQIYRLNDMLRHLRKEKCTPGVTQPPRRPRPPLLRRTVSAASASQRRRQPSCPAQSSCPYSALLLRDLHLALHHRAGVAQVSHLPH